MPANLLVEQLSGSIDLEAAAVGGTRVKINACEIRVSRASLNATLKVALRPHDNVTAALERIESGTIIVKGRYNVFGFGAEVHVEPGRSGRIHLDLETFSALRMPIGDIASLRERVAKQLRAAIRLQPGVVHGTGKRLVTIDPRTLAKQRGVDLPPLTAMLVDRGQIVLRFGPRS